MKRLPDPPADHQKQVPTKQPKLESLNQQQQQRQEEQDRQCSLKKSETSDNMLHESPTLNLSSWSDGTRPPPVNCPERIVFAIDCCSKLDVTCGFLVDGTSATLMDLLKKAIKILISRKLDMNLENQFAVVEWGPRPKWRCDLTRNVDVLHNALDKLVPEMISEKICDLHHLLQSVKSKTALPDEYTGGVPEFTVRTIVFYARPQPPPILKVSDRFWMPLFTADVLYIFDRPRGLGTKDFLVKVEEPGDNRAVDAMSQCQKAYETFQTMLPARSYVLSTLSRPFALLKQSIRFLGHPLQRPSQSTCSYKIYQKPSPQSSSTESTTSPQGALLIDVP